MKCPECGAWTLVLETRRKGKTQDKRRRYKCANGHRFSTVEVIDPKKERASDESKGVS